MKRKRVGDVLRERGNIDQAELDRALATQQMLASRQDRNVRLGEVLVHGFNLKKREVASAIEEVQGVVYTECRTAPISAEALALIPRELALRCCALPLDIRDKALVVVMAEPQNLEFLADLRFRSGLDVSARFGFREEIIDALLKLYPDDDDFIVGIR